MLRYDPASLLRAVECARLAMGLTRTEAMDAADVNRQILSFLAAGKYVATDTARKLAGALGFDLADIALRDEDGNLIEQQSDQSHD